MAPSRGQGGQKHSKCTKMLLANLALVLSFERTEVKCGKGLLAYGDSARV